MIRLTLAILVLGTGFAPAGVFADEIAAPRARQAPNNGNGGVAVSEVDPGLGAPGRPRRIMPPRPRIITQPELQNLVRTLPPLLRNQHQQCMRQLQPDRRVRARMIVRMRTGRPGEPADAHHSAQPAPRAVSPALDASRVALAPRPSRRPERPPRGQRVRARADARGRHSAAAQPERRRRAPGRRARAGRRAQHLPPLLHQPSGRRCGDAAHPGSAGWGRCSFSAPRCRPTPEPLR